MNVYLRSAAFVTARQLDLKDAQPYKEPLRMLVAEKAVCKVHERCFVFAHRAKVPSVTYTEWNGSPAVAEDEQLRFGSLVIYLDTARQRAKSIRLGVVDLRCQMTDAMVGALADWIVADRVAVVTGWFGYGNGQKVAELAEKSGATWKTPLFQEVRLLNNQANLRNPAVANNMALHAAVADGLGIALPNYFIIFGRFSAITWPSVPTEVPEGFRLGVDLIKDMEVSSDMPCWAYNERGSPFVSHLGKAAMKPVDFRRVAHYSFQTSVWFGASTPSQRNLHRSRGKGKSKGKAK